MVFGNGLKNLVQTILKDPAQTNRKIQCKQSLKISCKQSVEISANTKAFVQWFLFIWDPVTGR